jgi:DNA phosphorothioation-dependent restriction protein DptH
LLYPIADTEADSLAVFDALKDELDRRKGLFANHPGVDSLASYNRVASEPVQPIVCLTDEATALLGDKGVENAVRTLVLRGRKFGIWLCLGGQDWKASSLDTAIRNQLSARVQFKAMSASQSRVLLQQKGAEELDVPGRALAVLPGRGLVQFQAPLVNPDHIMAEVSGNGPRNDMPSSVDVSQDGLICALADEGLSRREIEQEVFGYTGGKAYREVKRVLDGL